MKYKTSKWKEKDEINAIEKNQLRKSVKLKILLDNGIDKLLVGQMRRKGINYQYEEWEVTSLQSLRILLTKIPNLNGYIGEFFHV